VCRRATVDDARVILAARNTRSRILDNDRRCRSETFPSPGTDPRHRRRAAPHLRRDRLGRTVRIDCGRQAGALDCARQVGDRPLAPACRRPRVGSTRRTVRPARALAAVPLRSPCDSSVLTQRYVWLLVRSIVISNRGQLHGCNSALRPNRVACAAPVRGCCCPSGPVRTVDPGSGGVPVPMPRTAAPGPALARPPQDPDVHVRRSAAAADPARPPRAGDPRATTDTRATSDTGLHGPPGHPALRTRRSAATADPARTSRAGDTVAT